MGVNVNEKLNATFDDDNAIDEQYAGWSPLHATASLNHQDVVDCLLQK